MKPIAIIMACAAAALSAPAFAASPTAVNSQITDKTSPSGHSGHDRHGAHSDRAAVNAQITDKTKAGMDHRHF
jgi:hypothetical protein